MKLTDKPGHIGERVGKPIQRARQAINKMIFDKAGCAKISTVNFLNLNDLEVSIDINARALLKEEDNG
jgi:pyruvate formate-lyase activating enzyme-like uncharacterized protein